MSGAICLLAEENCIFCKIHVELALAACCSLRKGCLLELAQQLIATDVSTGEGYRLRPLECLYPRPVLGEPFFSEMAK